MAVRITTTWGHLGRKPGSQPTVYEALKAKLGREPTNEEIKADVRRILASAQAATAAGAKPGGKKRKD